MLGMINNKMHASLSDEEREYIDKVLSEAKMNYIEVEKNEESSSDKSLEEKNKDTEE
jgi:23S rRNA pseudoU1915 N3-methylase RlmH